jgi:uncharacterized protein (DUF924 family)
MMTPDDVLDFWLGTLRDDGTADPEIAKRWWKKDPAFDEEIRRKFGDAHELAARGELDVWASTPRGRVALVIVLDQFSRNLFRNDPRAFAQDPKALSLTKAALDADELDELKAAELYFLLMPFMHAEDQAAQDRGLRLYTERAELAASEDAKKMLAAAAHYAKLHRDIILRFGRFPHRNAVVGRESTPEEVAFLKEPNSSF